MYCNLGPVTLLHDAQNPRLRGYIESESNSQSSPLELLRLSGGGQGTQIDFSAGEFGKGEPLMRVIPEPGSSVNSESEPHEKKPDVEGISLPGGKLIDLSDEQDENA
jgi:hypothetical protein